MMGRVVDVSDRASGGDDASSRVRDVLDLLLQDCSPQPVAAATLPWDRPMFVLRSAGMNRLQELLAEITRHAVAPALHVMSHARDAAAIERMAPCAITFHPYPAQGRYRLDGVPAAMLAHLRAVDFGSLLFLDTGPQPDFYDEVERLLSAIAIDRMIAFREDGTFAKAPVPSRRRHAEPAFLRLVEWYQRRAEDSAAGDGGARETDD